MVMLDFDFFETLSFFKPDAFMITRQYFARQHFARHFLVDSYTFETTHWLTSTLVDTVLTDTLGKCYELLTRSQ